MYNILEEIKKNPNFYRRLSIDEELITLFDCPLDEHKVDAWSHQNYFVYVIEGKKIWHTQDRSMELTTGSCIFVKRGAHIIEQFFNTKFCVVLFFVSDKFISQTLLDNKPPTRVYKNRDDFYQMASVDADDSIVGFFNSVIPFFMSSKEVSKQLLELKFKELLLNVVSNPRNQDLTEYFYSLQSNHSVESIKKIMEENYCFNLMITEYARLCGMSLSAFKRFFEEHFQISPGRWLLKRRLMRAKFLLQTTTMSVSEIAFNCGFENTAHFSKSYKLQYGHAPTMSRIAASKY